MPYIEVSKDKRGAPIYLHVLVACRALGKLLPNKAVVHHVDEDPTNNIPVNLVICQDQQYHLLLHRRMNALKACGDANALYCVYCGKYDSRKNLRVYIRTDRNCTERAHHKKCRSEYMKDWWKSTH